MHLSYIRIPNRILSLLYNRSWDQSCTVTTISNAFAAVNSRKTDMRYICVVRAHLHGSICRISANRRDWVLCLILTTRN
jgi:hypothetical protein